ncbi:hypothetical protein QZH41_007060 [Actinostola sp. cb2023]|nr:hypothetical protein QZH41_007060 [Actinostola sp. cb2023]
MTNPRNSQFKTSKKLNLPLFNMSNHRRMAVKYESWTESTKWEELHDRTKRKMIKTEIKKTSSIYCLDPYLDQGTLRVGGRLSRANLPPHSVHPIILPRENHVTALIIKEAHKILGHTGRGHVLSRLRERYWIISANAAVRHVLSKCVICRRSRGKPNQQKMADLPKERVTPAPPFTFTGVDYFGPYIIRPVERK